MRRRRGASDAQPLTRLSNVSRLCHWRCDSPARAHLAVTIRDQLHSNELQNGIGIGERLLHTCWCWPWARPPEPECHQAVFVSRPHISCEQGNAYHLPANLLIGARTEMSDRGERRL